MENSGIISEIKKLRIKIDGLAQLTKELKPNKSLDLILKNQEESVEDFLYRAEREKLFKNFSSSKEIEKVVDSLYLAKAWLGKIAGELGENTPYTNDGKRKTVEDIEPTQDVAHNKLNEFLSDGNGQEWKNKSHIEKVDFLREKINVIIQKIINFPQFGGISGIDVKQPRETAIARTNSYTHLCEARFWLGFELQRIKENI